MSWRDRAKTVEESPSGSWRDRAKMVSDEEPIQKRGFLDKSEAGAMPLNLPNPSMASLPTPGNFEISRTSPTNVSPEVKPTVGVNTKAIMDVAPTIAGLIAEPLGGPLAAGAAGGMAKLATETIRRPGEALRFVGEAARVGPMRAIRESDLMKDVAKEAAIQAAPGVGMPIAAKAAGKIGRGATSVIFGPSMKAVKARLERPGDIINALPVDEAAKQFETALTNLSGQISKADGEAVKTLSTSKYLNDGAFSRDDVLAQIDLIRKGMGRTVGKASELAKSSLAKIRYQVGRYGPTISQNEMKHIITQLDQNIDWEKPGMQALNDALTAARTRYDDILKSVNRSYAEAMKPVAEKTKLFNDIKSLFQVRSGGGRGYEITDKTVSALKNVLGKTRGVSREILDGLKKETGLDFVKMADDAAISAEFSGGKTQGSRRVNLGTILGAVLGGSIGGVTGSPTVGGAAGATAGAIVGAYLDTAGGKAAASLIDLYNKTPSISREAVVQAIKPFIYGIRQFAEQYQQGQKPMIPAGVQ